MPASVNRNKKSKGRKSPAKRKQTRGRSSKGLSNVTAYCFSCQQKKRMVVHDDCTSATGHRRASGVCSKCGTSVSRFLKSSA